ncbi:MAG: hypothetical protein Q7T82_16940 [Armatimonadota bacterium]|nr:hypothetical protein [Armatimonadota bacterium]
MPDEKFKLPRSSYEELTRIIKGYGECRGPASLSDVGARVVMDNTIISSNNGFLMALGVIEGGNRKQLTANGRRLAAALGHDITDEIRAAWRDLVTENEFFQKVISAVRIRNGMEPSALRAHIAYTAGLPKKPSVSTGAGTVLDILLLAGLIRDEEGKYVAQSHDKSPSDVTVETVCPTGGEVVSVSVRHPRNASPGTAEVVGLTANVQIQVQIQCSAAELDLVAPKIRALLSSLAEPAPDVESGEA